MQTHSTNQRHLTARGYDRPRPDVRTSEVAGRIGDTPLLRLDGAVRGLPAGVELYAKAEYLNPGGSVKDRPALSMIRDGLRTGRFGTGQTLIDATSGNTGIAYAMLGASLGFKVALAMPANASRPRKDILRAYGADVILTDWLEGTDGARRHAAELAARHPDRYFYPDQYNNDANWRAHYVSTGPEIIKQTAGRVTHFVASLGTTGTFTGVVRRLRADMQGVRSVAVQPDSPMHGIEGVKHLETADVPGIFDASLVDEQIVVSTEEAATETARLAQAEGLLVGTSSGANVAAAAKLARTLETGVIVTVLCDTGTRYLGESTHLTS